MDNSEIILKFWKELGDGKEMVLSTAKDKDVTSRSVSTAVYKERIYFVTSTSSTKYQQIQANSKVSLCLSDIYMKRVAKDAGKLNAPENKGASDMLSKVYPEEMVMFSHALDITLIEITLQSGGFGRMKTGGMYSIDFKNHETQQLSFEN